MKLSLRYILAFVFSMFFLMPALNAQGFLKVDGKRIVDAKGNEIILRGMGLGGWMLQEPYMLQVGGAAGTQKEIRAKIEGTIGKERTAAFYEKWLQNHCRKIDIDSMASWGFNSVRLPMHFNLFTLPIEEEPINGKNTWLKKGFEMTDKLLSWCKANKIYLILDLHAAPGGQGNDRAISDRDTTLPSLWDSEANRQKTVELWRKLAKRYANEKWIGGYDLINETNWGFQDANDKNGCAEKLNEPLRKHLTDITNAIREVDKKHIIFIEANCWANNYDGMFPLWDNNLVVSFHKYWNYNDQQSIEKFLKIRDEQNVPVWMGESGENSNVWFTAAIELLEKNKIGWAWWPLKKLGYNNPMQIKQTNIYQKLVDNWRGKGEKVSANDAYTALMQLAEDVKAENTIFHKDVIDAMFRQVSTTQTIPFKNHIIKPNAIVFATDYDLGRNGYAYNDKDTGNYWVASGNRTAGNNGHMYRNDGVDITECKDEITNGFKVSSIEAGEWMEYTINTTEPGVYDVQLRYSSRNESATVALSLNNLDDGKEVILPGSDLSKFSTGTINNVVLKKGVSTLRLYVLSGGFELNYLQFVAQASSGQ